MSKTSAKPLIGIPACVREVDGHPYHVAGDKYLRALVEAADCVPLTIPAFGDLLDLTGIIGQLDGLMLTGSKSNVHPSHYQATATPEHEPYDQARDRTTLTMITEALGQGVPLLAICRGIQELNVALGGSLHARVHEQPGFDDHRRPVHDDLDVQYGPRHPVALRPDGDLCALFGTTEIMVNSLHWQAIDRLSDRLIVEATAPDGTIEAVRVADAANFALGVQWHPEYKVMENEHSRRLFTAFGDAARTWAVKRAENRA